MIKRWCLVLDLDGYLGPISFAKYDGKVPDHPTLRATLNLILMLYHTIKKKIRLILFSI